MLFYIILSFSVLIDWASKVFMGSFLGNRTIDLVGNYLALRLVRNSGIAFSLPIEGIILKMITVILIGLIGFYYFRYEDRKDNLKNMIFGLILGGAIGNGIERILYSKVTDFVSVKYFAIFNFADIFINVGVILLIYAFLKNEYRRK